MSDPSSQLPRDIAVVAIGRNEGQRMVRCLEAALAQIGEAGAIVYVDSGSTDGSVQRARQMGVTVLELDMSVPFTAARARNFGFDYVRRHLPQVTLVQFLDADCEMLPGWIDTAAAVLRGDESLAGVAGQLQERHPEATIYNKLCHLEWRVVPGESQAVGGNAMLRAAALEQVGGYNPALIGGEEPEMCLRLRERGWRLWRLAEPMALHDAAMTRFGEWWRRAVRCGYGRMEVFMLHRHSPQRIWLRESLRTLFWGLAIPTATLVLTLILAAALGWRWWVLGLIPLGGYVVLWGRVFLRRRRGGDDSGTAALYASSVALANFPQLQGQARYWRNRLLGRRSQLIEYKTPQGTAPQPAPVGRRT